MFILIFGFLYSLVFFPRRKYKKQTKVLVTKQAEQLEKKDIERDSIIRTKENEVMRLNNEKLQNEINFKNQELASSTMHIVQKTEILDKIKAELQKAHEEIGNKTIVNVQIKKVLSLIRANVRLDKNWDQFAHHFDQVHIDFNKRLKEDHPDLSPNDLKLCAYLRMNLATKEIAPLLNISVRGVEISRYRLRKKLNLDRETHLSEFLANI
jgi:DNA-binding CsgD family transcriptional regulator